MLAQRGAVDPLLQTVVGFEKKSLLGRAVSFKI
jgi:hypothetical protein